MILLCVMMCTLFSSCATTKKTKEAVKEAITVEFEEITKSSDDKKTLMTFAKEGAEITVIKIEKKDKEHYAVCDISNYDIKKVFSDYVEKNKKEKLTNEKFLEAIEKELQKSEKTTTRIEVLVEKNDKGEWTAKFTQEQLDILLGGFLSFSEEFIESLKKG